MSLSSLLYGPTPDAMGTDGQPQPERGLSGFLGRVMNPTNGLGQFGQALIVAGGSPLADAFKFSAQQRQQTQENALNEQYRKAQIAKLQAGPEPDEFTRTLIAAGIDPKSPAGIRMYQMRAQNQADPIIANVIQEPQADGTIQTRIVGTPNSALRQSLPGAMAPQTTPAPLGGDVPPAPALGAQEDPAQIDRFIGSLRPELREAARRTLYGGASMPQGSPLSPTNNAVAPRGKSPNRAALLREAQDAIARGADPAKVHARLRQMGVK